MAALIREQGLPMDAVVDSQVAEQLTLERARHYEPKAALGTLEESGEIVRVIDLKAGCKRECPVLRMLSGEGVRKVERADEPVDTPEIRHEHRVLRMKY